MPAMPHLEETDKGDNPTFKWGKKRGVGGAKKEVQFYESFTYDEIEYVLYDCVYLYKEGEPEPYIGKLIKLWEQPNRKKKIKVLWFFRPIELLNWLGDDHALENEIFLACGEGMGLANVNPLEVIAGKCNVICTSKDERNPQPSNEEMKMADFIFFRTFDVGNCTISDKFLDKIAGVEVRYIFNRKEGHTSADIPKLEVTGKDDHGKVVASNAVPQLPSMLDSAEALKNLTNNEKPARATGSVVKDADSKASLVNSGKGTSEEPFSDDNNIPRKRTNSEKDEGKAGKIPVSQPEDKEKLKPVKDSDELDSRPSKKLKVTDNSAKPSELQSNVSPPSATDKEKSDNSVLKLRVESDEEYDKTSEAPASSSEDKSKVRSVDNSVGQDKGTSKKVRPEEKKAKLSDGTLHKTAAVALEKDIRTDGQILEVTRRPDADRSKWFKGLDIIWHGFRENCTAKVIQRTMTSSPYSGRAFVIFKTKEAAEMAVRRLDQGCLMLPNGRPLVASKGTPVVQGKQSQFFGHLFIDKIKFQMQRDELKKAVSTSHCSQPNTIEYEMAMEWRLLQAKSDIWWKDLYKQQGEELRKLRSSLKSK
ncbi:protein ANTI-SILENCING 1 isoform X2 [Magnolia sinica]|uniref:protein ANTI-SILENCING 1 isoform X2 n=1 Tax=Magnolia sinica TaxID=86752 RepID=UPI0026597720|nr:protein ANTI-SILENCING 1 isoform X2 [Magnolia sinica]